MHTPDLSDFTAYTTDTAPWEQNGAVVTITVEANWPDGLTMTRNELHGIWSRALHGLKIPRPRKGKPDNYGCMGLTGMVRVQEFNITPKRLDDMGFVLEGRCLAHEEEAMRLLLLKMASSKLENIHQGFQAMQNEVDALAFQAEEAMHPIGHAPS